MKAADAKRLTTTALNMSVQFIMNSIYKNIENSAVNGGNYASFNFITNRITDSKISNAIIASLKGDGYTVDRIVGSHQKCNWRWDYINISW